MTRTPVNPWPWSQRLGYNQAELMDPPQKILTIAGQTSVDANGAPQHAGDVRAQLGLALDNLEAVLAQAGMSLSDLTKVTVYSTDVDATLANFDLYGQRMAGAMPPMSLLGVTRLALPPLMVEIEATAST